MIRSLLVRAPTRALLSGAAVLLAAGLAGAAHADGDRSHHFDYMYVESNEGGSAGGHAGIRFGDDVYHFQYGAHGLSTLSRVDAADYLFEYALLRNRSLHGSRVPVDAETFAALRGAFDRRYLAQRERLRRFEKLHASRRLLEELAEGRAPERPVAGAGYFAPGGGAASPLEPLRRRLRETHGDGAFEARRPRLALPPDATPGAPSLARRLDEALAANAALDLLASGAGLREDAVRAPMLPELALSPGQVERLRLARAALTDRLVALFDSPRPDWGAPFLLGMARWLALQASIERASLVVLDSYPEGAERVLPRGARWRQAAPSLLEASLARFAAARERALASPGAREMDLARMEALANRHLELQAHVVRGVPLRVARERLRPSRSSPGAWPPLPDSAALRASLASARQQEERFRDELEASDGYHVIAGNCVTAIFETLDEGLAELAGDTSPQAVARESQRRLGGHVQPARGLAFVPFVSSQRVRGVYRDVEVFSVDSLRSARLAEMRAREPALWVHLRESNVLSSTLYERSDADSVFLFFTEDHVLLRPLYGAVNLGVGLGAGVAGLFAAPFDRGQLLRDGLQGALVSLPELFFFNIRKGSNEVVLPSEEPLLLAQLPQISGKSAGSGSVLRPAALRHDEHVLRRPGGAQRSRPPRP